MPPPLALLLCTASVLVLLRLERRQSSGVSGALWIPTVWMLTIASKPLGVWFGVAGGGDNESGSMTDRLVLMGLGAAGMVVLARRRFDWLSALRGHGWLLGLLAYMLASTMWSDITFIALRRWVREAIVVPMALVVMSEGHPREALACVMRRTAYILIPFSLVLIKYYPGLGVEYGRWSGALMWIGVTSQKNGLGRLCMLSAFFLFWALCRRNRAPLGGPCQRLADFSVLLIAVFLLKGPESAYSATSIATFATGIAALVGLLWMRKVKLMVPQVGLLALVVFLIGFGVSAPFLRGSNIAALSSSLGRDETLTGRTKTWAELAPIVSSQPLVGSGFGTFWTSARREFHQMSNGHNGYLDTLLELGAVGLAFQTVWLLTCTRKLHRALRQDFGWASLALSFLLMRLVYNATESAFASLAGQMTALVVLTSLVVPYVLKLDRVGSP